VACIYYLLVQQSFLRFNRKKKRSHHINYYCQTYSWFHLIGLGSLSSRHKPSSYTCECHLHIGSTNLKFIKYYFKKTANSLSFPIKTYPYLSHWRLMNSLFYRNMLYRVHLAWVRLELTTLVVIGTYCIGSYKSNYCAITTTKALKLLLGKCCDTNILVSKYLFMIKYHCPDIILNS